MRLQAHCIRNFTLFTAKLLFSLASVMCPLRHIKWTLWRSKLLKLNHRRLPASFVTAQHCSHEYTMRLHLRIQMTQLHRVPCIVGLINIAHTTLYLYLVCHGWIHTIYTLEFGLIYQRVRANNARHFATLLCSVNWFAFQLSNIY